MLELNQVYCGDCLELMKEMPDKSVDLVLTDPPYGIGKKWVGGFGNGWGNAREQGKLRNTWDDAPPSKNYFDEMFRISKSQIIFGGNYFTEFLPPSRCWIIWTKPERDFSLADAELAWSSFDNVTRVFDGVRSDPNREHPTQKPLSLMMWCLEKYSKPGMTVLDPFMGSGTTCVACKKLGRNYIGIDKEPAYVEIARKRIERVNNRKLTDFW